MNLHGPVRAGETAGSGVATLTISLDGWPDGLVAPTTHDVTVVRPKPGPKPEPVSASLIRSLVHPDRAAHISLLRYSPDGRRLAVAGDPSGVLQIWDAAAGKELHRVSTPPGYQGIGDHVALTADWATAFVPINGGKVLTTEAGGNKQVRIGYAGEVRVWDVATGRPRPAIKLAPDHGASLVWVSPAGSVVITAEPIGYDRKQFRYTPHVAVFRNLAAGGKPVELATGLSMAAFAPDGKTFVLATGNPGAAGRLTLHSAADGRRLAVLAEESKASVYWPAFDPDGRRVVAEVQSAGTAGSVLKVWDTAGKELATLTPAEPAAVEPPTFSPDGRFVATSTSKQIGYVWDAGTGKVVLEVRAPGDGILRGVAVSPDGRRAAVSFTPGLKPADLPREPDPADLPQPHVRLYDMATGRMAAEFVCPHGFPGRLAFAPDGETLTVGGVGAVHLFDLTK